MSTHHNLASSLAPQLSSWECCRVLSRVTRLEKRTIKEKDWIILVGTGKKSYYCVLVFRCLCICVCAEVCVSISWCACDLCEWICVLHLLKHPAKQLSSTHSIHRYAGVKWGKNDCNAHAPEILLAAHMKRRFVTSKVLFMGSCLGAYSLSGPTLHLAPAAPCTSDREEQIMCIFLHVPMRSRWLNMKKRRALMLF